MADDPNQSHLFAWDGVSFRLPAAWHLALFKTYPRGLMRVEFEDDYNVRLECEWIRPRRGADHKRLQKRYDQGAKRLTELARQDRPINGLPPGWVATFFQLDADQRVLTAFCRDNRTGLLCFMIFHAEPQDRDSLERALRMVASEFRVHDGEVVWPWAYYDARFTLPGTFRLNEAKVEPGQKMIHLRHGLRRLYIWHMGLANHLLAGRDPARWAAGFLNRTGVFKGIRFYDRDSELFWRRAPMTRLFGHYRDFKYACFHYHATARVYEPRDQLIIWAMHYRREQDLRDVQLHDPAVRAEAVLP